MDSLTALAVLAFTSFFTLINPLGVMPIFMTMTGELSPAQRGAIALKASLVAFGTLVGFAFSGKFLFDFFGISVDSFRMAGGIIFFMVGFDMLHARLVSTKISEDEIKEYSTDISITPLGIPMICGPGAITNAIVLMEAAKSWQEQAVLLGAMFGVLVLTYLILLGSSRIIRVLGQTGNKILMRLMGLIVMVIAIEFFFSGLIPMIGRIG